MKKSCVIGWPISHSRSPLIHTHWLKQYGIEGSYTRKPVRPEDLNSFIANLQADGFAGCNCTIPHKEAVYRLVPAADDYTRRVGAINTVYIHDGKLSGTNTDGAGFLASLASSCDLKRLSGQRVLILGAGGAALAIIGALQDAGFTSIAIANRTPERIHALQDRLGGKLDAVPWDHAAASLGEVGLLVNTTSLGMSGQPPLELSLEHLPQSAAVTDIVYTPLMTPLLSQAQARGNVIVPGLGMLLHQAVPGFELWFGVRPTVTEDLYDLVARDVDPGWKR